MGFSLRNLIENIIPGQQFKPPKQIAGAWAGAPNGDQELVQQPNITPARMPTINPAPWLRVGAQVPTQPIPVGVNPRHQPSYLTEDDIMPSQSLQNTGLSQQVTLHGRGIQGSLGQGMPLYHSLSTPSPLLRKMIPTNNQKLWDI